MLKQALPIVKQIDIKFFGTLGEQEDAFIDHLHMLNTDIQMKTNQDRTLHQNHISI